MTSNAPFLIFATFASVLSVVVAIMTKHWYFAYQNADSSAKNLKLSPHMA
jgi:hypothetical protein